MANSKIYNLNQHSAGELINHMDDFLANTQGMETQILDNSGFTAVQARAKSGSLKQFIGLDKAVTLRFYENANTVTVEIGETKWIDKSVVMGASAILFWPLAFTSGYGFYKQKKLIDDVISEMDSYMC